MKGNSNETQTITHYLSHRIFKRKIATQMISFSDAQELRSFKKLLAQKILSDKRNNYSWN
ncbi:unnamed protein product [Paramecium pentaurelia]|uniref:Uncharacterized protein n=1 Tax=Paramecium pentaurelia TaxID=43138 RepID=A0A8S1V4N0_9CILI|nr:unnamed protein product [Paramecium pentaurelia]